MLVKRHLAPGIALLAALTLCVPILTRAQQTQRPVVPTKPGEAVQKQSAGSIRVKVQVVNAPVAVRDSKKNAIVDLKKEDFQVFDNKEKQTVEAFDLAGEPLSTVLVLETSSRVGPLLPALRKSAIIFTQTVVGPSGNAAVIGYDKTVQRLQLFTANQNDIEKAITTLKEGDSSAHLYDAMADAVAQLRDQPEGRRRVIILVGESRDPYSTNNFAEVLREALRANIVVYSLELSTTAAVARAQERESGPLATTPPGTFAKPPYPGVAQTPTSEQQWGGNMDMGAAVEMVLRPFAAQVVTHPLEIASAATGGLFQPTLGNRSIENALAAIGGDLNTQYTLSYEPTKSEKPGYHEIKIIVNRKGAKVRTRPGYYLEAK
jgi:VWFA-related protein